MTLRRLKAADCPDADGRQPQPGEQKWTLTFPLEGGDDYLEIEIGRKGREALKAMLGQEAKDDAAEVERLRKMGLKLLEKWRDEATLAVSDDYSSRERLKHHRHIEDEYQRRKAEWEK